MLRKMLLSFALLFSFLVPELASAQSASVVVQVKGSRRAGARRLKKSLTRALKNGLGQLASSTRFRAVQQRVPAQRRTLPSELARAAVKIGADYIVFARAERRRGRGGYQAVAYILDTEGKVKRKFTERYRRPAQATEVGEILADRALDALSKLAPRTAAAPAPVAAAEEEEEDTVVEEPVAQPAPRARPSRRAAQPRPRAARPKPRAQRPQPREEQPAEPPKKRAERSLKNPHTSLIWAMAGVTPSRKLEVTASGASVLSSSNLMIGFSLGVEHQFSQTVPVTLAVSGQVRRQQFSLQSDSGTAKPAALVAGFDARLGYRISLSKMKGGPLSLAPELGLFANAVRVDSHASALVPSSTAAFATGGLALRAPFTRSFELSLRAYAGMPLVFREDPIDSGSFDSGLLLGGVLRLCYWVSADVGVLAELQGVQEKESFTGGATRGRSSSTAPVFTDVERKVTEIDARLGVSFAF